MYETFFGLREKPFSLLPDPAYLYLSKQHEMAMDTITAFMARDDFLPFPLDDVLAQIQADEDDLIMALMLSY